MGAPCTWSRNARSGGFGIVELMVAMTLSLLLLGGVVTLFANARKSYENNDHLARIQENGRFALDQIARELRAAGYLGCAKDTPFTNALTLTTNKLLWDFQFAVQGFQSTGTTWSPALDATLAPSAAAVNSDVLVIRAPDPDARAKRVTTLMATPTADIVVTPATPVYLPWEYPLLVTDCNAVAVFDVSAYSAGTIAHGSPGQGAAAAGGVASAGNSTADIGYAFQAGSLVMPVRTVIYYVRASATPGAGNSLWRRLGRGPPDEVVEGVDSLQVLYGVDTDANRIVDAYEPANNVTDWSAIVSVRVGLLVRSVEQYGKNPDTAHKILDETIAAAGDNRERLEFSTTVALRNEAL